METLYLKTLIVTAEKGSFSKAAAELCITQSAVSQRVKFLEERYGCELLDRSGPVMMLTAAGEAVVRKAQAILDIEKTLQDELKKFTGRQRLSICCTPSFGIAHMPKVLNRFMLRNADIVDLKFMFYSPEQAVKGLAEREFDIGIIEHCEDLDLADFHTATLPRDELVFVSAPSLGIPTPLVTIERLFEERLITRKDGCSSKKLLRLNLASIGKELEGFRSTVVYDDLHLTVDTVLDGGGVAFVSSCLVNKYLESGRLKQHRVEGFCHSRQRTVALSRSKVQDRLVSDFLACLDTLFTDQCHRSSCPT
ncbi:MULTISPECIES: LysR family transcriptional regulator [Geobacter]|uniref:LysR family transcriptional regulator n=1 Tax=Geobacter TaxID=28231 RepID=UPI002574838F|nr:LysR family transcriptional regulator [Geobacter sulfurreducens]BEH09813.1 LysR family transcriptional regulator [Geobacter sulfurreducens subsp. ethanolicus]BET57709.1 LysR family transcriptional regulator [Geobacter sp. 60473]HML78935.1 LysR family transcriptional regulator [Geobacter sulfurreducens]